MKNSFCFYGMSNIRHASHNYVEDVLYFLFYLFSKDFQISKEEYRKDL
jgi:hypothetical protein